MPTHKDSVYIVGTTDEEYERLDPARSFRRGVCPTVGAASE